MKLLFTGAIAVAGIAMLSACSVSHGVALPATNAVVDPDTHKTSTHYAAVRTVPVGRLVVDAKEYDYETVLVRTSNQNARIFVAPQSVSSTASAVRIVDGTGHAFVFPAGSTITRGSGRHYVLPGRSLPGYLAHAKLVRTLTEADVH